MEFTFEAGQWWSYLIVFVAAAVPVIEVLLVIPPAILAGMSPLLTAIVAFAGNMSTVVLVAFLGEGIFSRLRKTRLGGSGKPSPRMQRAGELVRKWGVPGLGLLAPLLTGTHLATIAALTTGASVGTVLRWMTLGLLGWSFLMAGVTAAGLDLFT